MPLTTLYSKALKQPKAQSDLKVSDKLPEAMHHLWWSNQTENQYEDTNIPEHVQRSLDQLASRSLGDAVLLLAGMLPGGMQVATLG